MDSTVYPQNSYADVLTPNVIVFEDRALKEIAKVKRSPREWGPNPIGAVSLEEEKEQIPGRHARGGKAG